MKESNPSSPFFAVTTPGLSATRWLAFVLASNKDVFVAHGKHALDSVMRGDFQGEKTTATVESLARGNDMRPFYDSRPLDDILAHYQRIMPQARAHGCVHSYTIHTLALAVQNPKILGQIRIRHVVRHPVAYLSSHVGLVRAAEKYPSLYQHYVETNLPDILQQFPELFLLPCPDYRAFVAFAVSCLSVAYWLFDQAYPGFRHVTMESLTTQRESLQEFCEDLTGLRYEPAVLEDFIRQGAINQHRPGGSRLSPHEIYARWPLWQQDMAHLIIPATVLDWLEELGYDLSMFRENSRCRTHLHEQTQVPCLGDYLRSLDQRHPLLTFLSPGASSRIQTIDSEYHGFDLKQVDGKLYALARSQQIDNLSQVDEITFRKLQDDGLCLPGDSVEQIWQIIAGVLSSGPKVVEEYRGFNLVAYRDRFYALSVSHGPMDLDWLKPRDWEELEILAEKTGGHEWRDAFVSYSLQELKDKLDAQATADNLLHCPEPRLLEADYRGYNLVLWKGDYYGMHQDLGPVDLPTAPRFFLRQAMKRKNIVVGRSPRELKEIVDCIPARPRHKMRKPGLNRLLTGVRRLLSRS